MLVGKASKIALSLLVGAACLGQAGAAAAQTNVSTFGWDGDQNAAIAYDDGGYLVRHGDGTETRVAFGIFDDPSSLRWSMEDGYLPNLITEFERDGCLVRIENFADEVTIGGNAFVAAYSRVLVYNDSGTVKNMPPDPSPQLIPLNSESATIAPGEVKHFDYAIFLDRFGNSYPWPSAAQLASYQTLDEAHAHMKDYWEAKLAGIANITQLPDPQLIEAYKAGYVYTHIIKDGYDLNVGENGYDEVFDHDSMGILATLMVLGDFGEAQELLNALQGVIQYDDAKWKFSWPYSLYLLKSDDVGYVSTEWAKLQNYAHTIAADMTGPGGVMKETNDVDSLGHWTVDNWSGLLGLLAYQYAAERLGETTEAAWAATTYDSFLQAVNGKMAETVAEHGLSYLPASIVEPNTRNRTIEPTDANWGAHLLFGRWAWDGWLFGGAQYGVNLELIDDTYDYGFGRLDGILPQHTYGGYPGYSSAYNAGYGASGLRTDSRWRSAGIRGYQLMIDSAMNAPYGTWESIGEPVAMSWEGIHPGSGGGSCPHMWGQSMATKVLIESIIAERYDETVVVGRGIPNEWLSSSASPIEIENVPIAHNRRMGVRIDGNDTQATITLTGEPPLGEVWVDLPIFVDQGITHTTAGTIDSSNHRVVLPSGTTAVTVSWSGGIPAEPPWPSLDRPELATEYRIRNRWEDHGVHYLYDDGDLLGYESDSSGDDHVWLVEIVDDRFFIRNKATGDYLNIEAPNGQVKATPISMSWHSARWDFQRVTDDTYRIFSMWDQYGGDAIHVEGLTGTAQHGDAPFGWWSSHWVFEPVDDEPTTGCTCPSGCNAVVTTTAPLVVDGVADTCYYLDSLSAYVNSWETDVVNLDGQDVTNFYVSTGGSTGGHYLYVKSSVAWAHMDAQ